MTNFIKWIENLELMTREEHTSYHSNLRKLVE